jgi:hypothetical protein
MIPEGVEGLASFKLYPTRVSSPQIIIFFIMINFFYEFFNLLEINPLKLFIQSQS